MVQDVFTGNADGLNKQTGTKRNSNEKKEKLPEGGDYICFPLEVSALHHFCFCDREPSQTSVNLWRGRGGIMDAPWLFPVSAGLSATVSLQQHQTQAEQFQAAFLIHPSPAGSRPSPPHPRQRHLVMFFKPDQAWGTSDRMEVFSSLVQTGTSARLIASVSSNRQVALLLFLFLPP